MSTAALNSICGRALDHKLIAHILSDLAKIRATACPLLSGMHLFDKCTCIDVMLSSLRAVLDKLQRPVSVDGVFRLNRCHDERDRPYLGRRRFRPRPLQLGVKATSDANYLFGMRGFCIKWISSSISSPGVDMYGVKEGVCGEKYGKYLVFCRFLLGNTREPLIIVSGRIIKP